MSGSKYGGTNLDFHPPMRDEERHHARLDFDKAQTAAAKVAWFDKWAERIVDHLWEPK